MKFLSGEKKMSKDKALSGDETKVKPQSGRPVEVCAEPRPPKPRFHKPSHSQMTGSGRFGKR
jgi:hypothetical protein